MRGTQEAGWGEGGVQGVRPSFGVKSSREAGLVAPKGWSGMGASEERRVSTTVSRAVFGVLRSCLLAGQRSAKQSPRL